MNSWEHYPRERSGDELGVEATSVEGYQEVRVFKVAAQQV